MRLLPCCLALCVSLAAIAQPASKPIRVKVVVVAMFEVGNDSGDKPGEYQYWVERDHLDTVYPLPAAYHDVRMNADGELAIVTGQGTAHAASTIMALGLDPRFDLSHAYWLVAGIAGGNPESVSLGSAVWANWVLDSDLGYEIDGREIPQGWTTGILPLRKSSPYEAPAAPLEGQIYQTNRPLMEWAYQLTRNVQLADDDHLKELRSHYDSPAARKPPLVLEGDEVSGSRYWHGKLMNDWAQQWMTYFSNGQGHFATTAMEDTGTLQSLQYLARAGKVDWQRILILRTVSNFDQQPNGLDAASSLSRQRIGAYGAYLPSLEAAYRAGHAVVGELIANWSRYEKTVPAANAVSNP